MKRHYIYLLTLIVSINIGYSQTPINDLNWDTPCLEDNFDGTSLNTSIWWTYPPWGTCVGTPTVRTESTDPNHGGNEHIFNNGILSLISRKEYSRCYDWKLRDDGTPWKDYENVNYVTGEIRSKNTYKYGYFETSIKLPQLDNDPVTGQGFGPAFFLWPIWGYGETGVNWSEIDIFEINALDYTHTFNVHYEDEATDNNDYYTPTWSLSRELGIILDPRFDNPFWHKLNFNTFHKIACEWSPTHIKIYVDDKLIFSTQCRYADDLIPMNVNLGIATPTSVLPFTTNTLFPYTMEVDYVKVYKLKMDCNNDFYSSSGYANFDHAVKRYINLSSPIPFRRNFSFRATQSIDLEDGFEVPLGSSVYIDNNVCE